MKKRDVKITLASVEKIYRRCWDMLASLKSTPDPSLSQFQVLLSEGLMELSRLYDKIGKERKRLIGRKQHVNRAWFNGQQRLLARHQRFLLEAAAIGRAMGDAFAWFFYQNNLDYLERHAQHLHSEHIPPGLGGIGEVEFIRRVRTVGDMMVLYHGITTILRIGDVSLIDLNRLRVAAIGELKTTSTAPDKITVSAILTGTDPQLLSKLEAIKRTTIDPTKRLSLKQRHKLRRQMNRIGNMVSPDNQPCSGPKIGTKEDRHVLEFDELLRQAKVGKFAHKRMGDGLLCGAFRSRRRSLFASIASIGTKDLNSKFGELVGEVNKLMLPSSSHNTIHVGVMLFDWKGKTGLLLGTIPLFWWDLNLEGIRRLMFREILLVTIYNPAHLISKLENAGFSVKPSGDGRELSVTMQLGDKILQVERMAYFVELVRQVLFSESQVVANLVKIVDAIKARGASPYERFDIRFKHHLFKP